MAWSVAGADPSGGAGIQADLKTFHGLGVYGGTVLTAVIAQNTRGIRALTWVSPALLDAQLAVLAEDLPPDAVKLGALGRAALVRAVAGHLAHMPGAPVVCDPVLGSTGGTPLLDAAGLRALRDELLPRVDLLTPNLPEAERLCGFAVRGTGGMERAAAALLKLGARAVLVKGGHARGAECRDLLATRTGTRWYVSPRVAGRGAHGTGCTLAAAVTAGLARGLSVAEAVALGKAYVDEGLRLAPRVGHGRPPLHHAHRAWQSF